MKSTKASFNHLLTSFTDENHYLDESKKNNSLHTPSVSNDRIRRAADDFVTMTSHRFYHYWLTLQEVTDIAYVEYNDFKELSRRPNSEFQSLNSLVHLTDVISYFQTRAKQTSIARETLIVNQGYSHWITLVLSYHREIFTLYYVDSLNYLLSVQIQEFLNTRGILLNNLSLYLPDRIKDGKDSNVGLWALEIAEYLNKELDKNLSPLTIKEGFPSLHLQLTTNYFKERRIELANKLKQYTHSKHLALTDAASAAQSQMIEPSSGMLVPALKKAKIVLEDEAVKSHLKLFVKTYINYASKELAIYHIIAKNNLVSFENLKIELRQGSTGALLGGLIAQGIAGSIPAVVATARSLGTRYYTQNKTKARKVTLVFEKLLPGELSHLLASAAVEVFHSFESQFMSVTDSAGEKIAIEKLAEDAATRSLNYIVEMTLKKTSFLINRELLSAGVILGQSEEFFDLNWRKMQLSIRGSNIVDKNGEVINTAKLYEQAGIRVFNTDTRQTNFYKLERFPKSTYGYRKLLPLEKESNGALKKNFITDYQEELLPPLLENNLEHVSWHYNYVLKDDSLDQDAKDVLDGIKGEAASLFTPKNIIHKKIPILFNLRKSISNFSGREEMLSELHRLLTSSFNMAVISQSLFNLRLDESTHSNVRTPQVALSGLGGIGKTQLALRYAESYASYYDNNVIWINADTKGDIVNSLIALASQLNISEKNIFGYNKDPAELLPEIYQYFSNKKSLFIFDSVKNYQEFYEFLPKNLIGNIPTILLTSRFSHWENIFPVLSLNVFTEKESIVFIKKELNISLPQQEEKIKILHQLLQGLPLALGQAAAYIKKQQILDNTFGIDDYIEHFKSYREKTLSFEFASYINDPYAKTVLITWKITLDAIKNMGGVGKKALAILNIMAYFYPDNIKNNLFLELYSYSDITSAIHLLKSYSMISTGSQSDISVIHRLVQKVIRTNLEDNFTELKVNANDILLITQDHYKNQELGLHYIYFLLHMANHEHLVSRLKLGDTKRYAIDFFILSRYRIDFVYFYDAAHLILTKKDYIEFMGEALFLYVKHGLIFYLSETIAYLEKQLANKLLTVLDMFIIFDYRYKKTINCPEWLAHEDNLLKRRLACVHLILAFQRRVSEEEEANICRTKNRNTRDLTCQFNTFEKQARKIGLVQDHLHLLIQSMHLASEKLIADTNFPNFSQAEWNQLALHFEQYAGIRLFTTELNSLWVSEELFSLTKKGLSSSTKISTVFNTKQSEDKVSSFLSHIMKITRPFIKRAPSSIGNSYTIAKELKKSKRLQVIQGNNTSSSFSELANFSLSETNRSQSDREVIRFLNLINDASMFTGEMAEAPHIGTWLAHKVMQAIHQVKEIERYTQLSKQEKLTATLRELMHLPPSGYLDAKAINNQLAKNSLYFLNNMTFIQRYVSSAAYSSLYLVKDNQVFLHAPRSIKLDPDTPDKLANEGASLFCLSGILEENAYVRSSEFIPIEPYPPFVRPNLVTTYLCKGALGVELTKNRTGNATLIDLGIGTDSAIGDANRLNIFLVNNGDKNYKGGNTGNLFFVQGDKIKGTLEGGNGENMIVLAHFSPDAAYALFDKQGLLCGEDLALPNLRCEEGLQLKRIQHIYGREQLKDIIFLRDDIKYVDGFAGKNEDECDHIYLTRDLTHDVELAIRPYTIIHALDYNDLLHIPLIHYQLNRQMGNASVHMRFDEPIKHQFKIGFSLKELDKIVFSDNEIFLTFSDKKNFFNLRIFDPFSNITLPTIQFLFESQQVLRLASSNYLYIRELGSYTVDELVDYYSALSQHLQMILRVFVIPSKIMLQVGYADQAVILYTEPTMKNYLISQGDKTVYLIKAPLQAIEFPIPEIVIFSLGEKNTLNALDLREIANKVQETCPTPMIKTEIAQQDQDLILRLTIDHYWLSMTQCAPSANTWTVVTIRLRNVLVDNAYKNLEVILHNSPLIIAFDEHLNWHLQTYPLIFGHDKSIIILAKNDLIPKANIIILKDMNYGKCSFFSYNETDLILTNVFNPLTPANELCTVVYRQFYQVSEMREKVLTTKLTFLDQQIILKQEEARIVNATRFDFKNPNLTQTIQTLLSKEKLDEQVRRRRAIETKQPLVKPKNILSKKQTPPKLHFNRLGRVNKGFFDGITSETSPYSLAKPSLSYHDSYYSHATGTHPLTNNTDINSQSLFLTWIYHTLWGKKPAPVKFRHPVSMEMENERQVYQAIEYYEKLQNDSRYVRP